MLVDFFTTFTVTKDSSPTRRERVHPTAGCASLFGPWKSSWAIHLILDGSPRQIRTKSRCHVRDAVLLTWKLFSGRRVRSDLGPAWSRDCTDNAVKQWHKQRFVWDCRSTDHRFRQPPILELGGGDGLQELVLPLSGLHWETWKTVFINVGSMIAEDVPISAHARLNLGLLTAR